MENARSELIAQIKRYQSPHNAMNASPIAEFCYEMSVSVALLAWLKAQESYPQGYLNFRDSKAKIACVGKVRWFSDKNLAQNFVSATNLSLFGGVKFNQQTAFWLPRLVLECREERLFIRLYLDNQQPLEQEKRAAVQALENLAKSTALQPIFQQKLERIEQKADEKTWCGWVQLALDAIEKGELSKVVLANESLFESEQVIDAKDFLAESEKQNTGCYHFLLAENQASVFVGSTPERLYARQGDKMDTEALAGTALVSADPKQTLQQKNWLLNDPKNDYENLLVVKDISDNLTPYFTAIQVGEVEVKQLRRVQHLRRAIQVILADRVTDVECLTAIHPTAAVSGLPQQSAVQFLRKTETFDRSWYAGTLGMMSKMRSEFCVTIRSAFIEQNKIRVFAGAGIVAGSEPLLEWQEIERKASGLVSLFNL